MALHEVGSDVTYLSEKSALKLELLWGPKSVSNKPNLFRLQDEYVRTV